MKTEEASKKVKGMVREGFKIHDLKILPEYFEQVNRKEKTFEIRKNDRDFKQGDLIALREFDGKDYTGRFEVRRIGYMTDFEQKDGYVVFGLIC